MIWCKNLWFAIHSITSNTERKIQLLWFCWKRPLFETNAILNNKCIIFVEL